MKEVSINILCNVDDKDINEIKRLEHHAEGIFSEYPEIKDAVVTVKILGNSNIEEEDS